VSVEAHLGERLSACVDGELTGEALAAAERHLAACAECRASYDDLLRLRRRAGALDDRPPQRDLWPAIAARIGGAGAVAPLAARRRRIAFSLPQLAAAAVALVALSAGGTVLLTHRAPAPAAFAGLAPLPLPAPIARTASAKAVESYDAAIRDLEAALAARSPRLDTVTVQAVERSLAVINAAIRQVESALAQDPNSLYLNNHLEHALDQKVELLRRVTTLAAAS
jgi:anti-sigma factor RsiW